MDTLGRAKVSAKRRASAEEKDSTSGNSEKNILLIEEDLSANKKHKLRGWILLIKRVFTREKRHSRKIKK
ncbi:MAG: hypothetical protein R3Y09_05270 [Clostridia bacterium]